MSRNTCAARSAPTRIFLEIPLARAGFRSTIFLNFPVYSASKFRQIYVACDTGARGTPRHVQPVSIHASAREATAGRREVRRQQAVSIHASAREATRLGGAPEKRRRVSIHASAREATPATARKAAIFRVSIHASAREATVTGVGLRG